MTSASAPPDNLQRLRELLVCPRCRGSLAWEDEEPRCRECGTRYPVNDGIPDFAPPPLAGENGRPAYQDRFRAPIAAAAYREVFVHNWRRRWRTRRERHILSRLLDQAGRSAVLLDLPCGGGRLSAPMVSRCELLVQADMAAAQVALAREYAPEGGCAWLAASALELPLKDASVDGAVCARLSHHLDVEQRARLVGELLRVARRFAIISFADAQSPKEWLRRWRGRPLNPYAMSVAELEAAARAGEAKLVTCPSVSRLGSRHRYGLLLKER